ncbi:MULTISPECIES: hypothetical protein [Streptomyces]|uniref:Uncharacterized protein n=1 Tax=Streptomyces glycanivorans TaxID=3033808 RepID=A0ABY9JNB8_9ACTN|nr:MULTISPECIES: hypothetical protein [unclassified Streptomyces]WLQ69213.1 hypothetical protein P8A20_37375 [Streptomyces sp. Alt3]WSR53511.1 hypothetical protein OG279_38780 [Streptomyces sp. NBC_01201]
MVNVLVRLTVISKGGSSVGTSGLDLAIACSVLAAVGQLPADCRAGAASSVSTVRCASRTT